MGDEVERCVVRDASWWERRKNEVVRFVLVYDQLVVIPSIGAAALS